MQPMHLKAGARIFTAGDPSTTVYIIESGMVSITVGDPLASAEAARLGPGELFGESGVLEQRPRSATATALTEATLLATPAETFLTAFGMNNERALSLVKMICRRLRDTTRRNAGHSFGVPDKPEEPNLPPIRLLPDHPLLSSTYGVAPIPIQHLPFEVGNRFGGEAMAIASNHSLTIQAHGQTDLGAPHFEILRRDGRIGVLDLGTARGTIVNGLPLMRTSLNVFATLHDGDNHVIAGGADSPFRFLVQLSSGA